MRDSRHFVVRRGTRCELLVHFDDVDLERRNGIEWVKFDCIDRRLLRGCRLELPTLFQQSSIGDLSTEFPFLFPIQRWAAISADSIWNWHLNNSNYWRKGLTLVHHTSTFPFKPADARKRPSGEKATDQTPPECPESLRGFGTAPSTCMSQTYTSFPQPLYRNRNELTNKSEKKWSERTRRSTNVRSLPQLSGANPNKRWEIRLGVWLLARVDPSTKSVKCKRRKVLQQLMDIVPVSVTLTDPSSEQLNSRPSSAFQRREITLP